MLALLMIFAAVWRMLQLSVLGSFTRTVRIRSVVSAVAVGFYACAEVWERAKDADGLVRDPNTDRVLEWDRSKPRTGQWDMGHIPEQEYRKLHEKYIEGEITKEEFLREYRDPDNYKPEDPSENRSGKHEAD